MLNETDNTNRLGNLLVITAPSGAGKSTLVKRLRLSLDEIAFSISYTTRSPRIGEKNGR
ncbi:MAG: guanylate kinase, partial [bacterium]